VFGFSDPAARRLSRQHVHKTATKLGGAAGAHARNGFQPSIMGGDLQGLQRIYMK
jgi:hypothetical protein